MKPETELKTYHSLIGIRPIDLQRKRLDNNRRSPFNISQLIESIIVLIIEQCIRVSVQNDVISKRKNIYRKKEEIRRRDSAK